MGTVTIHVGLEIKVGSISYVLKRKIEKNLWQAEDVRTGRIIEFRDSELRTKYVNGDLSFVLDARRSMAPKKGKVNSYSHFTSAQWEAAKVRRIYVLAIIDLPSNRIVIEPIVRKTWEEIKAAGNMPPIVGVLNMPSMASVLRWKRHFISAGKDIRALISNDAAKGNGKPRFPSEVESLTRDAIDLVYLTRERKTIQDTLDKAIDLVNEENKLLPADLALPLPSMRILRRLINQIPAFDRVSARYGRTAAVKRFRAVLGHRVTGAPLERAEIDHALMDIFVIHDKTGMPLGRPWITVCIDDFTRCILGIHVTFAPPSYLSVASCLKMAIMPKNHLKGKYASVEGDWLPHGVMCELVVDNAFEFHSTSLENACYSLGIELHFSPRKTPWFKGKVERFIKTMNAGIALGNPGTTFNNIFEKDDYDPVKHAVVRLSKLEEIITLWIVDHYHKKPHRVLNAAPLSMWEASISLEEIPLADDPLFLDAVMGRTEVRTLTHKGIELDSLLYNSVELKHLRERLGEKLEVELRIDDADIEHIIVLSPDKMQRFKVPALDSGYAKGLSRWQHKVCQRFAEKYLDSSGLGSWIQAKERIRTLIEEETNNKKSRKRSHARVARYEGMPDTTPGSNVLPNAYPEQVPTAPEPSPTLSTLSGQVLSTTSPSKNPPQQREQQSIGKTFTPRYRLRAEGMSD